MQTNGNGTLCNVTLAVTSNMDAPIYVYYELDKYYQNHRSYTRPYMTNQCLSSLVRNQLAKCTPRHTAERAATPVRAVLHACRELE